MDRQTADQFERAERRLFNRAMRWLTGILGLTTGFGIIAWGAWSLILTVGISVYERMGLNAQQVAIEDALNQGTLQSAMLIALGVVILELRRIATILDGTETDE